YHWSFGYGSNTGDLVTSKQEPSGRYIQYEYEPANLPRDLNVDDWEGRMTRSFYTDDLDSPPVVRQILRSGTRLSYPGGDAYDFAFDGEPLTGVTHVSTGASVHYSWDQFHNLTSFGTGIDGGALVSLQYQYTNPNGRHIAGVTATDLLNNQAQATF